MTFSRPYGTRFGEGSFPRTNAGAPTNNLEVIGLRRSVVLWDLSVAGEGNG
jgi:hypothetical protein